LPPLVKLGAIILMLLLMLVSAGADEVDCEASGSITCDATLDGQPWSGTVSYTVEGPGGTKSGSSVPQNVTDLPPRTYTIAYNSGGPQGALFSSISPSATEKLSATGAAAFTLNFKSTGDIEVNATFDDKPWSGEVNYRVQGPVTESGTSVPQSFSGLPGGTYKVIHNSGHPKDGGFVRVLPHSRWYSNVMKMMTNRVVRPRISILV